MKNKKFLRLAIGTVLVFTGISVYIAGKNAEPDSTGNSIGKAASTGSILSYTSTSGSQTTGQQAASGQETSPAKRFTASPQYAAALHVAGMAEGSTRSEAMEALIETWVANSPVDAADWAGSLPAGSFRDDALSALMFHWAAGSPADAAAWMARTGIDDPEAASSLAGRWAARDAAAASAWAANLSDPVMRRDAVTGVTGAWAEIAPEAAAAWVKSLPAGEKSSATVSLIAAWAESSPAAAASWLANQPEAGTEAQAPALAVLATLWAEKSPGAVSKFLNSLPEGPAREAATSQFAVAAAATAPAEALAWAMNLTDPEQRNQVVADACESWYDGSPEGFRSGISEALAFMDDAAMRKGVYEMLYERNPAFHDNLLKLADAPAPVSAVPEVKFSPAPAVIENTPAIPAPFSENQIPEIPDVQNEAPDEGQSDEFGPAEETPN